MHILAKGGHRVKKVTKLRTFSVPPLAPPLPASTNNYGGLFLKARTGDSRHLAKKNAYVTILGGAYPFH